MTTATLVAVLRLDDVYVIHMVKLHRWLSTIDADVAADVRATPREWRCSQ